MEWVRRIAIISVLLLSGCTMLGTYMNPQQPASTYNIQGHLVRVRYVELTPDWILSHRTIPTYRVGPYDVLNVIIWDHPELTTITTQLSGADASGFLVSDQGTISFPFAGTFKVAGLTQPQIQDLIAKRISNYIRNPQVTVRIAAFRSQEAQLMGEIAVKTIPLTDRPISLLDGLNSVGGTEVMSSDTSHIFVIRGNIQRLTIYAVNAKSPEMMMVMQKFILQNSDIVYVPPIPIADWNRVLTQILSFGSSARSTVNMAQNK